MAGRFVQKSYLYLAASTALVLVNFGFAQSPAARPEFEVASIKPNTSGTRMVRISGVGTSRFVATNVTVRMLIAFAYDLKNFQISGGTTATDSDRYDVEAKAAESKPSLEQSRLMLQALLADRFKLMVHRETKEMPVYALVAGRNGTRLAEPKAGSCVTIEPGSPPPPPPARGQPPPLFCGGLMMGPDTLRGVKTSMKEFVGALLRFWAGQWSTRRDTPERLMSISNFRRKGWIWSACSAAPACRRMRRNLTTPDLRSSPPSRSNLVSDWNRKKDRLRSWSLTTQRKHPKTRRPIVTNRFPQRSYALLAVSAMLVLPGFSSAQTFEVASVKPNTSGNNMIMIRPPVGGRFTATNARLKMLIGLAYKVQDFDISGGPGWIDSDGYDITAKAADTNAGIDQLRPMLQALLEDRFKLKVHRETKEMPVFALMAAKNGPKLPVAKEGGCVAFGPGSPPPPPPVPGKLPPTPCGGFMMGPNRLEGGKISMTQLVGALSNVLGRPVIDKTGFTGTFDAKIEFSLEGTTFGASGVGPLGGPLPDAGNPDTSRPSIFTALQEQLGLKLDAQKAPSEILVIDHAEKASEN